MDGVNKSKKNHVAASVKTVLLIENVPDQINILTQYWSQDGELLLENSKEALESNNMVERN